MKKRTVSSNSNNENIMELICADIINKKIYVTSGTMKRSLSFESYASSLINKFKALYPDYNLEVNDIFFLMHFHVLPA